MLCFAFINPSPPRLLTKRKKMGDNWGTSPCAYVIFPYFCSGNGAKHPLKPISIMQRIKYKNRYISTDKQLIDYFLDDVTATPIKNGLYTMTESEDTQLKTITVTLQLQSSEAGGGTDN